MRFVLRSLWALIAFVAGIGSVSVADTALEGIVYDEVVSVENNDFDPDGAAALYAVAKPVDFNINGLRVGSTEIDLIRALGKPLRIESWYDVPDLKVYHYNGLLIRIGEYDHSKTVDSIEITSESQNFAGLTIGSSLEDVRRRLGPEHYAYEGTLGYHTFVTEGYVEFSHDGTKITGIMHGYHGC
ncbi:MAG: hypothetical protein KF881_10030 [Acidobacteria bacterium]|nr:hypothetical protein [Acidobacteriota bacterium]